MRGIRVLLLGAVLSLAVAGCVSMPSGGPVQSYQITQGANEQAQGYLQFVPPPPGQGWAPAQIVEGFLTASASFAGQQRVAREYLTPEASRGWTQPGWSAAKFTGDPRVIAQHVVSSAKGKQDTATVTIGGNIAATLSSEGAYAVAAATTKGRTFTYNLVKYNGQWRISNLHDHPLLLTTTEFNTDYQLVNLYFFAPANDGLVPDPVYVPLQATQASLVHGLVEDLINQPPDWLGSNGATRTAFPKGTTLTGAVTVDGGTASVTLGGAATRASEAVKEQMSAQLYWTLNGAGQGQQQVQSIALYIGGQPFVPEGQANAIQNQFKIAPVNNPTGGSFYYLGSGGQLMQVTGPAGKPAKVASIGSGYSGLAVSPDGKYVAALQDGNVYTGQVGASHLTYRVGDGFTSLSWDVNDNLWAAGSEGLIIVSAAVKPAGSSPPVGIESQGSACRTDLSDVTGVRVAPDGVRIALVFGGQQTELAFGAIVASQPTAAQNPTLATVQLSPFSVCLPGSSVKSLSWYGAENVMALTQSESGDTLTEYPVNGGTSTTATAISGQQSVSSVTAYNDGTTGGLVAAFDGGEMSVDTSILGPWTPLSFTGEFPTYPG
jgi:hypothetical protein